MISFNQKTGASHANIDQRSGGNAAHRHALPATDSHSGESSHLVTKGRVAALVFLTMSYGSAVKFLRGYGSRSPAVVGRAR